VPNSNNRDRRKGKRMRVKVVKSECRGGRSIKTRIGKYARVSEGGVFVWDMRTASARFALLQAEFSRSSLPKRAVRDRGSFRCRGRGCPVNAPLGMRVR
jgi:hypothetical protein